MKTFLAVVAAVFIVAAMTSGVMAAEVVALDPGPETITLDKIQKAMAPVAFPHKAHQDHAECVACHHKTVEGEQPQGCTACHGTVDGAPPLKDALHKTCQDCHKEQAAAGKAAPTKCTECHKK